MQADHRFNSFIPSGGNVCACPFPFTTQPAPALGQINDTFLARTEYANPEIFSPYPEAGMVTCFKGRAEQ